MLKVARGARFQPAYVCVTICVILPSLWIVSFLPVCEESTGTVDLTVNRKL